MLLPTGLTRFLAFDCDDKHHRKLIAVCFLALCLPVACGGESVRTGADDDAKAGTGGTKPAAGDTSKGGMPKGGGVPKDGHYSDPEDSGPPAIGGMPSSGGSDGNGATAASDTNGGTPATAVGGSGGTPADPICSEACATLGELNCEGSDRSSCESDCAGGPLEPECQPLLQEIYKCAAANHPDSVRCEASGLEFVCGVCDTELAKLAEDCGLPIRCVF